MKTQSERTDENERLLVPPLKTLFAQAEAQIEHDAIGKIAPRMKRKAKQAQVKLAPDEKLATGFEGRLQIAVQAQPPAGEPEDKSPNAKGELVPHLQVGMGATGWEPVTNETIRKQVHSYVEACKEPAKPSGEHSPHENGEHCHECFNAGYDSGVISARSVAGKLAEALRALMQAGRKQNYYFGSTSGEAAAALAEWEQSNSS